MDVFHFALARALPTKICSTRMFLVFKVNEECTCIECMVFPSFISMEIDVKLSTEEKKSCLFDDTNEESDADKRNK